MEALSVEQALEIEKKIFDEQSAWWSHESDEKLELIAKKHWGDLYDEERLSEWIDEKVSRQHSVTLLNLLARITKDTYRACMKKAIAICNSDSSCKNTKAKIICKIFSKHGILSLSGQIAMLIPLYRDTIVSKLQTFMFEEWISDEWFMHLEKVFRRLNKKALASHPGARAIMASLECSFFNLDGGSDPMAHVGFKNLNGRTHVFLVEELAESWNTTGTFIDPSQLPLAIKFPDFAVNNLRKLLLKTPEHAQRCRLASIIENLFSTVRARNISSKIPREAKESVRPFLECLLACTVLMEKPSELNESTLMFGFGKLLEIHFSLPLSSKLALHSIRLWIAEEKGSNGIEHEQHDQQVEAEESDEKEDTQDQQRQDVKDQDRQDQDIDAQDESEIEDHNFDELLDPADVRVQNKWKIATEQGIKLLHLKKNRIQGHGALMDVLNDVLNGEACYVSAAPCFEATAIQILTQK